jgi:hypothetical protein
MKRRIERALVSPRPIKENRAPMASELDSASERSFASRVTSARARPNYTQADSGCHRKDPDGILISAKIEAGGQTADSRADDQCAMSMLRHRDPFTENGILLGVMEYWVKM